MKTPCQLRVARYRRLSLWASGPALLLLLVTGMLPVVRCYTVVNRSSESIYVTPLIHFRTDDRGPDADDEVPAQVPAFSVLSQYSAYQLPAWPAGQSAGLLVPAHGERALFIDYEDLKQETGAQVLVVRTARSRLGYLPADFWERTVVERTSSLPAATAAMRAAVAGSHGNKGWIGPAVLLLLAVLFPGLWLYHWVACRRARN